MENVITSKVRQTTVKFPSVGDDYDGQRRVLTKFRRRQKLHRYGPIALPKEHDMCIHTNQCNKAQIMADRLTFRSNFDTISDKYRCTARLPLRHAALPDNYRLQIITKRSMKCIQRYVYNGPLITSVLVWRKSIHFWWRYARKMIFTCSFPVTLIFEL